MALHPYTKLEIRGAARFLWAKRLNCKDTHRKMVAVYGKHAISKWCGQFENGRVDITDDDRPGRPATSISAENDAVVEEVIWKNRLIKLKEISSIGSLAHHKPLD
ncbi:hypothetical protein AVEN_154496-1 [Araneus ventricosus]|uniref:Mos1 transposase HTH domain-containing protein n=1 Tax=Araneus ventricosus TaxID=182803 RepID=A0A4Y2U9I4_ARAVE|nr:hypothetical protein AVEN_154496-1 [Araneus ventricosus]